jgi:hypothetical protein
MKAATCRPDRLLKRPVSGEEIDVFERRWLVDYVMGIKMRARPQRAARRYFCSRAEDASSGAPLGASCSGEGAAALAARTGLRERLRDFFAVRFADFLAEPLLAWAAFLDLREAVLRAAFAGRLALRLALRFAFLAIVLSLRNFQCRMLQL